jgi:transmembrane protein TMEM260 (protein O-mannosyltransferase)
MPRSALGAAWVAALLALWVYVQTLSPTVAWVDLGEDSGDLLAASATLGIPHPTGYPLFTLLGRTASLIPVGAVAFRINLIAALAGAASVFFLTLLACELVLPREPRLASTDPEEPAPRTRVAGAVAPALGALAYAFSRGAWSQSVLSEVYTLNAAFFGATLWASARADRTGSARHLMLAAFLLGLGLTNHLLLLAASAAVFTVAVRLALRRKIGLSETVLSLLLLVWGLTLDLYLPIRAARGPEFSWGAPNTPERLWWVLSGAQYRSHFFGRSPMAVASHLVPGRWWLDFGWTLVPLAGGLAAAAWTRARGLLPVLAAGLVAAALLSVYSIPDDVGYWMPVFYVVCAVAAAGWVGLWRRVPAAAAGALLVLALAGCGYEAVAHWSDVRPWVWAHRNLEAVEPNALVVSEYDGRTFALWFYKATEFRQSHPGLTVAYKYLLVWPWYRGHLVRVDPKLAMPPYPGTLDAMMNRLIARNIRKRPVYLVRRDPGLLPIFALEPAGYAPDPFYRVRLLPERADSVAARLATPRPAVARR